LHKHEKSADVIRMHMRKKDGIDRVITQTARLVAPIYRLATIHQNRRPPKPIKKRCMIPIFTRRAVAGAETYDCALHFKELCQAFNLLDNVES
jgi:5,10-methylenetetrahydrofolate reductase